MHSFYGHQVHSLQARGDERRRRVYIHDVQYGAKTKGHEAGEGLSLQAGKDTTRSRIRSWTRSVSVVLI